MTNPNKRDRELVERLCKLTAMSPTEIAREAGLAASTLTRVAHGHTDYRLSAPTIDKLKARFPQYFGDVSEIPDEPRTDYVEVEVLPSYAGMGGGGFGDGEPGRALVPRKLVFEQLRATPGDLLLIDVRGDSMMPEFIHGDQLLVDRRDSDPTQPGPFALWDGDSYVVKLVERLATRRGWVRVFSANERYTPYEVSTEELRILGRPVWLGRTL